MFLFDSFGEETEYVYQNRKHVTVNRVDLNAPALRG